MKLTGAIMYHTNLAQLIFDRLYLLQNLSYDTVVDNK